NPLTPDTPDPYRTPGPEPRPDAVRCFPGGDRRPHRGSVDRRRDTPECGVSAGRDTSCTPRYHPYLQSPPDRPPRPFCQPPADPPARPREPAYLGQEGVGLLFPAVSAGRGQPRSDPGRLH